MEYDITDYSKVLIPKTYTEPIGFLLPSPHPDLLYFIGNVVLPKESK